MGSQSWTQLSDSAQHTAQQHKFYSLNYYNFLAHVLNILASLFLHHQSPGAKKPTLVKPHIFFTPVPVAGEHHTTGLNHFTLDSGSNLTRRLSTMSSKPAAPPCFVYSLLPGAWSLSSNFSLLRLFPRCCPSSPTKLPSWCLHLIIDKMEATINSLIFPSQKTQTNVHQTGVHSIYHP